MLKKFVYVTGFLDYLLGLSAALPAFLNPEPDTFPSQLTLGAFLCFAAASLMWASRNLEERGCIVVWQAFVRLTAVLSTLYAIRLGLGDTLVELYGMEPSGAKAMLYGVIVFDAVVATVYIIGTSGMPGHSFLGLLRGRAASTVTV